MGEIYLAQYIQIALLWIVVGFLAGAIVGFWVATRVVLRNRGSKSAQDR